MIFKLIYQSSIHLIEEKRNGINQHTQNAQCRSVIPLAYSGSKWAQRRAARESFNEDDLGAVFPYDPYAGVRPQGGRDSGPEGHSGPFEAEQRLQHADGYHQR